MVGHKRRPGPEWILPAVVAVLALAAAAYFGYLAASDAVSSLFGSDPREEATAQPSAQLSPYHAGKAGFSVGVPEGMKLTRKGRMVQLAGRDGDLVVTLGPGEKGPLRQANRAFVDTLRSTYRGVEVLGHDRQQVDERPSLTAYGRARNKNGVAIRFAATSVRAKPRTFVVATYAADTSRPATVLPRANAILNSFTVGKSGQKEK